MRSHSQKITVERLTKALERQGVSLKRHQLIEVLAQTFGLVDSNDLAAVAKRGEIDPPQAESLGITMAAHPTRGGVPLMLLRDPTEDRLFALDAESLQPSVKADRFAVTPYGGLVALPEMGEPVRGYSPLPSRTAPDVEISAEDRKMVEGALALFSQPDGVQPGNYLSPRIVDGKPIPDRRTIRTIDCLDRVPSAFLRYDGLIGVDDLHTGTGPIQSLTPRTTAFVDNEPFLGFWYEEEYADHEQAILLLRDLCAFRDEHVATISRVGGILRWRDNHDAGRFDVEILLPARLADRVEEPTDWWDAVLSLIASPEVDRCMATFQPQAWQRDWAVDVDPKGETTYDVAFEILTMPRDEARAIRDNSDESDDLMTAARAPEWIRTWNNAFRIEIADEIERFLDGRDETERSIVVAEETGGLQSRIRTALDHHRVEIARLSRLLDDGDENLSDAVDDAIDALKGSIGAAAANRVVDAQSEDAIDEVERWIADNVSKSDSTTRIAAVFAGHGPVEARRLLEPSSGSERETLEVARSVDDVNAVIARTPWIGREPSTGTAATMPDGETTIVVDRVAGPTDGGGWTVVDQYGEEHVIMGDGGSWEVVVGGL